MTAPELVEGPNIWENTGIGILSASGKLPVTQNSVDSRQIRLRAMSDTNQFLDVTLHKPKDSYLRRDRSTSINPSPSITVFNPDNINLSPLTNVPEITSEVSKQDREEYNMADRMQKPMDDTAVRYRYLCKLSYKNVWNDRPKTNNLIIFDWDDTLFPTSAFMPRSHDDLNRIRKRHSDLFKKLDEAVVELFRAVITDQNQVAIVTNAKLHWVYYSSQLLLPKTAELLKGQVKVVTARVNGLDLPAEQWKISCFEILFQELGFDARSVTNLVVVGDSMNEIVAGQ